MPETADHEDGEMRFLIRRSASRPCLPPIASRCVRHVYKLAKDVLDPDTGAVSRTCSIDVIEGKSNPDNLGSRGIEPITFFDRTYVMNWVAFDSVVCLYPNLTYDKVGVDQVYKNDKKARDRKAKYDGRRFRTVRDVRELGIGWRCGDACVALTRDTRDVGTMVVPLVEGGGAVDDMPEVRWRLARQYLLACKNPACPRRRMELPLVM